MIIIISSKIGRPDIQASLGKPEYSYFFLLKEFTPALQSIGTVIEAHDIGEVDKLYDQYHTSGTPVVFLSFSPPYQTPVDLRCPTLSVFAWEFDNFPTATWDDNARNDWRYVFNKNGAAIATSRETARIVKAVMGETFPILPLPAPVWNRYADLYPASGWSVDTVLGKISFIGKLIDSPVLGLSADGLVNSQPAVEETTVEQPTARPSLSFKDRWNITCLLFEGWKREAILRLPPPSKPEIPPSPEPENPAKPKTQPHDITIKGIVYTSVLNPADGRKNWVDIVTAFCWAFKDTPDATLIMKMTHHDIEHYRVILLTLLSRLAPFKCRVLIMHGFLEDEQYRSLIAASHFYVNASSCEGLCLPLMEFLSAGKPAIAPRHTAMADYLNDTIAFLVKSTPEPTCWPHDPTGMLFSKRQRINWETLAEAYRASYRMATTEAQRYNRMSLDAHKQMQQFCSLDTVCKTLKEFLSDLFVEAGSLKRMPGGTA